MKDEYSTRLASINQDVETTITNGINAIQHYGERLYDISPFASYEFIAARSILRRAIKAEIDTYIDSTGWPHLEATEET